MLAALTKVYAHHDGQSNSVFFPAVPGSSPVSYYDKVTSAIAPDEDQSQGTHDPEKLYGLVRKDGWITLWIDGVPVYTYPKRTSDPLLVDTAFGDTSGTISGCWIVRRDRTGDIGEGNGNSDPDDLPDDWELAQQDVDPIATGAASSLAAFTGDGNQDADADPDNNNGNEFLRGTVAKRELQSECKDSLVGLE